MFQIARRLSVAACALLLCGSVAQAQRTVLFDASHRENAGNADWIVDADAFDLNQPHFPCGAGNFEDESRAQRFPTPPASGIDATTDESYWTGGISAFGVDLVRAGYAVESLPPGAAITFGDAGNPQDLTGYDVFVLPEPNLPFTPAETTAIRDFVAAGGGLFLIADHQTSDRDCDGHDSPHIGNDLMGVVVSGGVVTDFGLFGIVFNVEEIAGLTSADYWFDDAVDDNVTTDPADPIVHGPHGDGSGGLGFFGATAMTIDPATNATVRGHVWKTDAVGQAATRVTFATAWFGSGRIACIGDSSPADDGTGDPGDNLFFGWDKAAGGVSNREIHLNAVEWLAGPDTTPPTIDSGPTAIPADCSAQIVWTTDEAADGLVDYGFTAAYGSSAFDPAPAMQHDLTLTALSPGQAYHFRVTSTDPSGNPSTPSADDTFATGAAAAPAIVAGPNVTNVTGTSATIAWTTDEPADALVEYGPTAAYGSGASAATPVTAHEIVLAGLSPSTSYHYRVASSDSCGNGPTLSGDFEFTTAAAQIDISGWTLLQFNSSQAFAFPPGTTIPGAGYLVLGRDAAQAAFEAEWGPLPAGTVYVNSGGVFPFINGGESFRLEDELTATVDGTTITMSSGQSIQRIAPAAAAGDPASWIVTAASAGTPGAGAGTPAGAGVVIHEASDAAAFSNEFVELYYDAAPAGPDTTPPSPVTDLQVQPLSDTTVRLTWAAVGDDGVAGTAASYDVRHAPSPIVSPADFAAAVVLTGEPNPQQAGSAEVWPVTGLDPDTTYYFAMQVSDEAGNSSLVSNSAGATTGPPGSTTPPVADHLVLSEIRTRGAVGQDDEFIELHNPGPSAVSLDGSSVQYKSASGTTFARFDLPAVGLPAGGYFLLARPEYTGPATPDATWSNFLMGAGGGHVFLVGSTSTLSSCTDASIVDKIGYGSGDCPEASAVAAHAAGESIERAPGADDPLCGNGTDTDDNAADLSVRTAPDPQNLSGPGEPPCRDLGDVGASLFVEAGGTLRWADALGAADYKVRRSSAADFTATNPPPDDTHLLVQISGTTYEDAAIPLSGGAWFYFVNATDGTGAESGN